MIRDSLEVTKDGGPFDKDSVVMAWSSDGDYTIEVLPYYLRQQTEYIETVLSKYPTFHEQPLGPGKFGKIYTPIPTHFDVEDQYSAAREAIDPVEFAVNLLPFLSGLPMTAEAEWGIKNEKNFINQMYNRLYKNPSAMSEVNQSVFISYSSKDRVFARNLAKDLSSYGLSIWIDQGELKIGESLIWKISEAVTQCDFVLVILSKNSVDSTWVKKELEIAISQELSQDRYKVLPIIKDKCEIPAFLKGKVYSDFSNVKKRKDNISRIVGSICPMRQFVDTLAKAVERRGGSIQKNVKL